MLISQKQYNIGHLCSTRQCDCGLADKVALRWLTASKSPTEFTFHDLELQSNRFANTLTALGYDKGDIFFTYLPKCPEQFFSFLGALKREVVCGTLFSNFGDEALLDRLGDSKAKGLITKKSFLKKIGRIIKHLPHLEHILVIDSNEHLSDTVYSYPQLMALASDSFTTPLTTPDTPSVLHYTSGSTGKPKGVLHVHQSILYQSATSREILHLGLDDVYWCTADQGWVTGTSYGIIGPWSLGVTQIHYGGIYSAERWFEILDKEQVSVWYTAPTALRMLMQEDEQWVQRYNLSHLKHIFSVGEPLNPEIIQWAQRVLKRDIYDTWFQTETGGIMITNRPGLDIRPGSMGQPASGIEAAILTDDGQPVPPGEQGNLCLKPSSPSMFTGYLNREREYRQKFINNHYFSGDTAVKDEDGYYWFKGRNDDVINTGGHLISPFEIESALLERDEVAESAVIGVPDDILFEKVVAFVLLSNDYEASKELEIRLRLYIANKVSSIATPQDLLFVEQIPKNKSGKIMRRILKADYLGLDSGDISTLED